MRQSRPDQRAALSASTRPRQTRLLRGCGQPDGRLIVTATWEYDSVLVYGSQNGGLLVEFPFTVGSPLSLAWASDSKRLFVLSDNGDIHCLDVSTGTVLSKWAIHSSDDAGCIALASNGMFIAASASSSVSFWDITTHKRIGTVIKQTHDVKSMAVSANYDLVTGGDTTISLLRLRDILPSLF